MARDYYLDYKPRPHLFKNRKMELQKTGDILLKCVGSVLEDYGVEYSQYTEICGSALDNDYRGWILCYAHDSSVATKDNEAIDVSISANNQIHIDLIFDPLVKANTNDEIIADIKALAVKNGLITNDTEIRPGSIEARKVKDGGCYIATAVYGSYDCPQVWVLRRFRDFSLAQSRPGRAFIKAYYTVSPSLVKSFGRYKWFQNFWRKRLDKLVDKLKARGYEDTNYYD